MNAKETLQKIAEALGVAATKVEDEAPVEENAEQTPVEEVKAEEPTEETPKAEEVVEETTEEAVEAEPEAEEPKVSDREMEMQKQIDELKEILANALAQPSEPEVPELPKTEPKGLTHSPEKEVNKKAGGIGNKGDDIMSRVFKYINN